VGSVLGGGGVKLWICDFVQFAFLTRFYIHFLRSFVYTSNQPSCDLHKKEGKFERRDLSRDYHLSRKKYLSNCRTGQSKSKRHSSQEPVGTDETFEKIDKLSSSSVLCFTFYKLIVFLNCGRLLGGGKEEGIKL